MHTDTSHPITCDVAVIGGGLAGLSAAIEAAGDGRRVVLIEARRSLGGRARTHRRGGYALNEGAHALYVDGAAMRLLDELGRRPSGGVPDAGAGVAVDGELVGRFPTSTWALLRTPVLRGDRSAMARLFTRIGRLTPSDFATTTVDAAIERLVGTGRSARLAAALFRLTTYGNDSALASADAGIAQLQMSVDGGVVYLDRGWQTIVDDLADVAIGLGVEIMDGTKVERLVRREHLGDRAGAPRFTLALGGPGRDPADADRTIDASSVVIAGDPGLAASLLGDEAPIVGRWADEARPAYVATLDVGLATRWGDHPPFALGIDTPTYLSVHAPVADLAPEGHSLVHVMRYLPPTETPDAARDRAECEAMLDLVRPGWRDVADHVSFGARLVAANDQPRAATGGLGGRPPVEVPGTDAVFLAGDWVGDEGLLADAAVASGRLAGRGAARASRAMTAAVASP